MFMLKEYYTLDSHEHILFPWPLIWPFTLDHISDKSLEIYKQSFIPLSVTSNVGIPPIKVSKFR